MTNNETSGAAAAPGAQNEGIVFDTGSGLSEEEQREILAKINRIAEKNRRSLAGGTEAALAAGKIKKKTPFKAKKTGRVFPLLVNAVAAALLAGGFLLLSSFQGKTGAQIREGAKVYNSAERALIGEIRKETASRIEAKENEISQIVSQLSDVDSQLQALHSNNQELTAEQRAAEEKLRAMQDEYRASLGVLQDERSRILEDSRQREASLRAQLEARSKELAAVAEQSAAALNYAQGELERLSSEQEKAAAIEAQLGGYLASADDQIHKDQLAAAGETLKTMRTFLNTPNFQGIRAIQSKKEFYTRTITAMETMIEEMRKNRAAGSGVNVETEKNLAELQSKNAQLEETVAALNKTIAAFSSEGAGVAQRLAELESQVAAQRTLYSALEASAAEKDRSIAALEAEKNEASQTVSARDATITQLRAENQTQQERITNLDTQLTSLRQALQALSQ
jgi:chromosome segregation ATPase